MPDLFSVFGRQWKLLLTLTLAATVVAFLACLLSPKQYVGVVTALPSNSLLGDKARLFNQNIEALYAEIGLPDELDKIEGTSKLDTIFFAAADRFRLIEHYGLDSAAGDAIDKAALQLRKATDISRTGYGELKIKVWDKKAEMAADLANGLLQIINAIHERLQTENSKAVLQKLREEYTANMTTLDSMEKGMHYYKTGNVTYQLNGDSLNDSSEKFRGSFLDADVEEKALREQVATEKKLMAEYNLALQTTPKALLVVEGARPSPWADKPKTGQVVLFAFLASLLFSALLAFYVESRNQQA